MEDFKAIEFHHTRDFGKKINITFEFIKQNFKPLLKSIMLIAGPAVLIGSVMIGIFFSDFMALSMGKQNNSEALQYFTSYKFWSEIGLMYMFLILSYVITLATINSYIAIYIRKQSNQIEVHEVWESVRVTIWKYVGSLLLMIISAILIVFVGVIVGIVVQKISGVALALLIIVMVIGFIYLAIGVSLVFFVQVIEQTGFFAAAARSLQLVRGKWWSTFGISFVLSLIGGAISYIFIIPYYVFLFVTMFHNTSAGNPFEASPSLKTASYIFFTLYYLAQIILQTLPNIGLSFQYFNLVELKESKGLLRDIENFGQTPKPDQPSETF
ncbi:MAG: hypothetical protein JST48_11835 [Bacteroidetes bacterium]|nr:hypothetical protein [Bacteroidota bacterium]